MKAPSQVGPPHGHQKFFTGVVSRMNPENCESMQRKIWFFGHFGTHNFGNECTLMAIRYHLSRALPEAQVACICSYPEALTAARNIETIPFSRSIVRAWNLKNPLAKLMRKIFIGMPSELYRWLDAFRTFRGADMLIIPGTGLLTDAFGPVGWGPYNLFKWTLMAKLAGCKVVFASVGAGPINTMTGRYFVKTALSLADYRSYRDKSSLQCANGIGLYANNDPIYPDLVFSLPDTVLPANTGTAKRKAIVGLGLMGHAGQYGTEMPCGTARRPYLENLVVFAKWLLDHGYDIRLLIGDGDDKNVTREFKCLLKARLEVYDEERIIDEPALSVEQLLPQIAEADLVVATRFHNVLFALLLNKPVIAISFHHKCASLMSEMGLAEYCHEISDMSAERLVEQFQDLEKNAQKLKPLIRQKVEQCRKALDEQYGLIFKSL